jgi:hypothetical protein
MLLLKACRARNVQPVQQKGDRLMRQRETGSQDHIIVRGGIFSRGRILGLNWSKSRQSFPPCYSQSPV